jgi:hypothetical protein
MSMSKTRSKKGDRAVTCGKVDGRDGERVKIVFGALNAPGQ